MPTGYDNYWMCNRQETVPNLSGNGNLSDRISLNSYTRVQGGRQTSHLNDFLSTQKNKNQNMTSQDIFSYPQKTSQYDWASRAPQSSIPYNYQTTGIRMQQKDSLVYWQNLGSRHLDSRNSVAQSLNYNKNNINNNNMGQKSQLLENQYNKSTTQTPRIRVRDVYSLNKIAQNSVPAKGTLEREFERYMNRGNNINQRQQNPTQKDHVDHAKHIPSLFEVNPFRSLLRKPSAARKPSTCQDWFTNMYSKHRERVLPSSQYHFNNTRRNEGPYITSNSLLQELLGVLNQVDAPRLPKAPQNAQSLSVPPNKTNNTTKESELNLSRLPEDNYSLGQTSYRNPRPYSESLHKTKVPPVSQEDTVPIIEPISPPIVENDINSGESSIRVTAVISLPEWCGGRVLNKISVPSDENLNCTSVTESIKESENPEISNYDLLDVASNDAPNGCLKLKEEPTFVSEFSQDNTTEILIQTMKTEDFEELDEGLSQNSEQQISDKSTFAAAATTKIIGDNDNNTNNNKNDADDDNDDDAEDDADDDDDDADDDDDDDEDKNQNSDNFEIDPADLTPTGKFTVRVETTDNRSDDSPNTSEIKLEVTESNYKSKINRDKLDMLIEFINGSDKNADYVSEQNYSEKSKKQRKVEGSTNAKSNMSSPEKSKNSVKDTLSMISSKVARIEITRCSSHLPTTKSDDSAKKTQINTKNEEPIPVLKNQSNEVVNADKAKTKSDTKKLNPTDNVLWRSKEVQGNRPQNKDSKKNKLEKKQKIGDKSVSTEDQVQVTVTTKTESAEKSKNLETSKPRTDAGVTQSEKYSGAESCSQGNEETVGNSRTCDINQNEKPKVHPVTEAVKTELQVSSDLEPSVKGKEEEEEEEEELQKQRDQAQKDPEKKGKKNTTRIFPNLKYQFCESCVTVSPTECFWMNVISGEVKCSNCFKKMNLDSVKATLELLCDDRNLETKTNKDGCVEKILSPDRKNVTCNNSENQTSQKVAISSESSDDKKCQRRQNAGKEELQREKRRSVDENSFHERKEKRRKSEEKCGKKTQEQISETPTNKSKMHGVLECSKTDKSIRKSLSKDRSQSPRKEERPRKNSTDQIRKSLPKDEDPPSKVVRKMESNSEGGKKRMNSTEDLWPRKIQVAEEMNEDWSDKDTRKSVVVLETIKQAEKETTKDFRNPVDREKKHSDYKKTDPKKTIFSRSTDLLKENQCTKVQSSRCEKPQDRRKKNYEKRKSEKKMVRSAKEHGERKKRIIKEPLQYKDFVLKKSPVFYFSDTKKDAPFTKILEEVDATKRNRKCNEER